MDKGMIIFAAIAVIFMAAIIWFNILIVHYIIRRALKKKILPILAANSLAFKKYKWLGFFSSGDFEELTTIPIYIKGNPFMSIYVDVYYDENTVNKKGTIRIDTFMLFIRKVFYSPKFKFVSSDL